MLVFSKNKLISNWIKRFGRAPEPMSWTDELDGKPVKKSDNGEYEETGGNGIRLPILTEWVTEVDDKYLGE